MNPNENDPDSIIVPSEILPPSALEATERASIDIQIATAKRYPRTLSKVKSDMLSFATLDSDTASSCFYTLPRGGKNIQGPSVRLAEIAVACYGNLRAGTRIIECVTTGDSPHVTIQAFAMDLERNSAITMEKRRRIVGKKSKGGQIDEDDINLAANAGSAIAFRDAVFKVVPRALIDPVWEQAKLVAIGDVKTLADRRAKAFDAFAKMGADQARVLQALGKAKVDDVDLADLETLIGWHTALKDGESKIDDVFPPVLKAGAVGQKVGSPTGEASKPTITEQAAAEKAAAKAKTTAQPKTEPATPAGTPAATQPAETAETQPQGQQAQAEQPPETEQTKAEAAPASKTEAPAEPAPAKSTGGPTANDLRKNLVTKANDHRAGKVRVLQIAKELGLAPAEAKWDELDVPTLVNIDDSWDDIVAKIQNP
jgi:hypothetical protein